MAMLNALMSVKAVTGKLPVNLMFVAEGDEERMDVGLRQFMKDHKDLFKGAEAMWATAARRRPAQQRQRRQLGRLRVRRITTSGTKWGRGRRCPTFTAATSAASIAPRGATSRPLPRSSPKTATPRRSTASTTMRSKPSAAKLAGYKEAAKSFDVEEAARNLGVARFISDKPEDILGSQLDLVQHGRDLGRQHVCGGAGAILPNKITSKHNIRYVPNMKGPDLVENSGSSWSRTAIRTSR